jgi:stage 0 sporulation regulatory protein
MLNTIKTNELNNQITQLRQDMIIAGLKKGLNHPETIERSQELDKLIIKFERLILNKGLEAS